MALGADKTIAKTEFIEAMRQRLEAQQAGMGANVDQPDVQENLGALGQAVFRIATVHAETTSSSTQDAQFWQWVADVNDWLDDMATWQAAVRTAFNNWTPNGASEVALRNAMLALTSPPAPPVSAPINLRGRVQ